MRTLIPCLSLLCALSACCESDQSAVLDAQGVALSFEGWEPVAVPSADLEPSAELELLFWQGESLYVDAQEEFWLSEENLGVPLPEVNRFSEGESYALQDGVPWVLLKYWEAYGEYRYVLAQHAPDEQGSAEWRLVAELTGESDTVRLIPRWGEPPLLYRPELGQVTDIEGVALEWEAGEVSWMAWSDGQIFGIKDRTIAKNVLISTPDCTLTLDGSLAAWVPSEDTLSVLTLSGIDLVRSEIDASCALIEEEKIYFPGDFELRSLQLGERAIVNFRPRAAMLSGPCDD